MNSETTSAPAGTDLDSRAAGREGPDWYELDLFPSTFRRGGSRFDEVAACPVQAPRVLDAIVRAAELRLRALPHPKDLGHRSLAHRARLQQVRGDAVRARARLADGTYGVCTTCAGHISLTRLTDCPWARQCIYCGLGI